MRKNKKILAGAGVAVLAGVIIIAGIITEKPYKSLKEGQCLVKAATGDIIATVTYSDNNTNIQCNDDDSSYADITWKEAVSIVADKENISEEQAAQKLIKDNMVIDTYYNKEYQNQVDNAVKDKEESLNGNYAIVLNDTSGCILAAYSKTDKAQETTYRNSANNNGTANGNSNGISISYGNTDTGYGGLDYINYADKASYAGSVIKPLSVYGPALEKGAISWNTRMMDEPYMQVKDQYGNSRMWPENVIPYTYEDTYVTTGLAKSLNTIAIKVLNKEGVSYAADYISDKLGINVDYEKKEIDKGNTDGVLSNIGLGYLNAGVTVKDMAGYYQIFANGGVYVESHAVCDIKQDSKDYYIDNKKQNEKRVFSSQTAYIMNRMMKGVVSEGGTATKAEVEGVDVVGKTGTTDNYENNWFVGVTPQLVCAVWNGYDTGVINADSKLIQYIFKDIISGLHQENLEYTVPNGIKKIKICEKTGLIATDRCESTKEGYFKSEDEVKECNE